MAKGTAAHAVVQRVMTEMTVSEAGASMGAVLATHGGMTRLVEEEIVELEREFEKNPRATRIPFDYVDALHRCAPEIRSKAQALLGRVNSAGTDLSVRHVKAPSAAEQPGKLGVGKFAELGIRAETLGWRGRVDLLTNGEAGCEIREFKTGAPRPEHELQLKVYSLLWTNDKGRNPQALPPSRLVLSYPGGDVQVAVPDAAEMSQLELDLASRTRAARAAAAESPPPARPSDENCAYCDVRHMCTEYWAWKQRGGQASIDQSNSPCDLSVELSEQLGPRTWVARSRGVSAQDESIRIRFHDHAAMVVGQRLRILGAWPQSTEEEDDNQASFVLSSTTEIFSLSAEAEPEAWVT